MRIAVSGAHATGKTTLVASLGERLTGYRTVEEPYHAMVAEGHIFPELPDADDYRAQLEHSISSLADATGDDVVFDRCPVDFLAYLAALPGADDGQLRELIARVREALGSLDVVVYIPIESPDRIDSAGIELPRLRRRVDALLRDMLVHDGWALGAAALEVQGSVVDRVRIVIGGS